MARLTENLFEVDRDIVRSLVRVKERARVAILDQVRQNILSGEGQPPYSTRRQTFNIKRLPNAASRFARYLQSRRNGRVAFPSSAYFPMGYAQYRAVYRGEGTRTKPVTFELTGEFVASLRGRAVSLPMGRGFRVWVGFERQKKSYGRMTNRDIALYAERRAVGRSPFDLTPEQRQHIFNEALGSLA